MIRLFDVFRKGNFKQLSAVAFFLKCMERFDPNTHNCPKCGTKHPRWKRHGSYTRDLISFEQNDTVFYRITVMRYKCSSCKGTHAILPASIIPYGSYSLLFIIAVMEDYHSRSMTIKQLCKKYSISKSTLYEWKALYLKHKKVWLGLLADAGQSPVQFLSGFLDGSRLRQLDEFFRIAGVSFLQGYRAKTAHCIPGG